MRATISSELLTVSADTLGAELCAIVGRDGTSYLCPDERRNWSGRAPVLFPNTGWVRDGYALIDGRRFPYARHGFAKDSEFRLIEREKCSMRFELRWSDETLRRFPFRFSLRVGYRVAGETLAVSARIGNEGDGVMPCSIGFHPGFACPLLESEAAQAYEFAFPGPMTASRLMLRDAMVCQRLERYWDGIARLPVREGMFDGGSFTMTDLTCRSLRLQSPRTGRFIELDLGDFPNLVLWAPPGRPITNICMEPWYGVPDAWDGDHDPRRKPFTLHLPPGEAREVQFSLRCH